MNFQRTEYTTLKIPVSRMKLHFDDRTWKPKGLVTLPAQHVPDRDHVVCRCTQKLLTITIPASIHIKQELFTIHENIYCNSVFYHMMS